VKIARPIVGKLLMETLLATKFSRVLSGRRTQGHQLLPVQGNKKVNFEDFVSMEWHLFFYLSPAISASWSSVVGSKPTQTLAAQGFSKAKSGTCSCEDRNPVTSRCRECNEDICDFCVDAHQVCKMSNVSKRVRKKSLKIFRG